MNCLYVDIDFCLFGVVVIFFNSCLDDCIKLLICGYSVCGEFYFCVKYLKSMIKFSNKVVVYCVYIDIWVMMDIVIRYGIWYF